MNEYSSFNPITLVFFLTYLNTFHVSIEIVYRLTHSRFNIYFKMCLTPKKNDVIRLKELY